MLETQLGGLLADPAPGVPEALDLAGSIDHALADGLARVSPTVFAGLADAFAGSPLRDRVAEAADKIAAGSISDEHLLALAGARSALFGAVHDALLAQADAALGRTRLQWPARAGDDETRAAGNLLAGSRSWLRELAITGWRGVDHDLVTTAGQIIAATLAEPRLRRLATLLDGLAAELRACSPIATMDRLPLRRWSDLWSRAMLLAQDGGRVTASEPVSGRLLLLGADVHEHATAVQVQVHGILETPGAAPRLVRTSVAAPKVDTIVGPAVWRLFSAHPVLLGALAERLTLDVTDLPLLDSGDLVWSDARAKAGPPADPFATARVLLPGAVAPAVPPLERHPARIGEPVLVEGYAADGSAFTLGDQTIAVDTTRLPSCGPLTPQLVAASQACIGLLRWDGDGWSLQPVAVLTTVKRQPVATHTTDWALGPTDPKVVKAAAAAGDAVAVLRERAGRLLRR
ncbi:hypothetical protein [Dactylosporangium sp. NPDC000521]|uniref:hypothetical protein n=1 Tax=Dactylosporangium sp. NPDC000521 TaxID=3363975 RepID=UPI00367637E4